MKMTDKNNPETSVDEVKTLIKKKDNIEEQIKAYYDVLEDQGVGLDGPLVDAEGYPRNDVNLYQIRTARHNISYYKYFLFYTNFVRFVKAGLQNDHKAIMVEIEDALHRLHAREKAKHRQDRAQALEETTAQRDRLPPAFARVDAVTQGSPASVAGLKVGDEVIEFGSVNSGNFQNLHNIASVVQHSEGKPLRVTVVREGQRANMSLTPQRWSGQGLMGCKIVPMPPP